MMKNFGQDFMKQAQQMQEKMTDMQNRLSEVEVEGTSGAGMVRVVMGGKGQLKSVKIDPQVVSQDDVKMLEDLLVAAFHDAQTKVEQKSAEMMSDITGGFSLPENFKFPM